MNWILLLAILSGVAVAQGIFLGISALKKGSQMNGSFFYLGLFLIALSLRIGKSLFYYYWPEMSVYGVTLGAMGLWAIGPSILYYLRLSHSLSDRQAWIHFLPSLFLFLLIFWLDMSVMYYLYFGGAVSFTIYMVAAGTNLKKSDGNRVYMLYFFTWVINAMLYYQLFSNSMMSYAIGAFIASGMLYLLNFWGLDTFGISFKPKRKMKINDLVEQEISAKITELLEEGVFRENNLTIDRFAQKVEHPPYLVRSVIHQKYKMKFNDFLNHYRIHEVEEKLMEEPQLYTIEALANNAGFTSLTSFYSAFKKEMGCTPLEYKKRKNVEMISQES